MTFEEKRKIINRICSGKVYFSVETDQGPVPIILKDPNLDLQTESDYIYEKAYKEGLANDLYTLEESFNILKKEKIWSNEKEYELKQLYVNLENSRDKLRHLKYLKKQQSIVKKTIEATEKRIYELNSIKYQLESSTVEYFSETQRRKFLIRNMLISSDQSVLSNQRIFHSIIVYYYNESMPSVKQLREIARTDPWRLYWTAAKETGTSLFPHSTVEMTDLQYAIVLWSKIYDFAYESTNRPSDDIIDDDDKFDSWYKEECENIKKDLEKNNANKNIKGTGGQELFIPADAEGAKEVYELNDMAAKKRIALRKQAIEKEGSLKEAHLPDVNKDIQMEVNRLRSEKIQNRSRR